MSAAVARPHALKVIHQLVDAGSFAGWDATPIPPAGVHGDPDQGYLDELARARERSGLDESVVTGEATIAGRRTALVVCEFSFLAGSIGVAAAERLVVAIERATRERLPLVAAPASGGTRMQEGTVAFLQMVKISAAVVAHKAAGLPYLVYLRHPCTGGVFASWGSLGHVTVGEPGALIGFLGPRVFRALNGVDFPAEVQTAENLAALGLVDAVIPLAHLRRTAIDVLTVLAARDEPLPAVADLPEESIDHVPAWESINRSRRLDRPGVRGLLTVAANTVTPLHGTDAREAGPGVLLALARFGAVPCVVVGHDRRLADPPIGPGGLREARRAMRLARDLNLPLVTVIDTAGAALSPEAEEGGLAGEIARCIAELTMLSTPTLSLLLGQGAGGAALALLPADRVLCAQHAWLAPLPPEGAAAILYRSPARARDVADKQGVRGIDLLRHGIVDRILAERPDAADEPSRFLHRVGRVIEFELTGLLSPTPGTRPPARLDRYRRLGLPPQ